MFYYIIYNVGLVIYVTKCDKGIRQIKRDKQKSIIYRVAQNKLHISICLTLNDRAL